MIIDEPTSRDDLEFVILDNEILPVATSEDLAALSALSTDELRAAVVSWVLEGDETDPSCHG